MSFRCEAGSSDDTLKRFDYIISFASSSVGKPWAGGPEMREVCQVLHTAKADFDKKPMIMFVGAFSAGKSTLINTLLGQKLCDTGIKPTTSQVTFISTTGMAISLWTLLVWIIGTSLSTSKRLWKQLGAQTGQWW